MRPLLIPGLLLFSLPWFGASQGNLTLIENGQRGQKYRAGDKSQRDRLVELELARKQFYADNKRSWVIFTPSIVREGRRFAKWSFPVPEKELAKAE
jgi:hypothetical protein